MSEDTRIRIRVIEMEVEKDALEAVLGLLRTEPAGPAVPLLAAPSEETDEAEEEPKTSRATGAAPTRRHVCSSCGCGFASLEHRERCLGKARKGARPANDAAPSSSTMSERAFGAGGVAAQ